MATAKFIETHLTCAICKDEFKDPRCLPCMHRFCLACLDDLIQSNVKNKGKKKNKKPSGIDCPQCRLFVKLRNTTQPREVWAEQFPADFALKNIQGEIQSGDVVLSETNHGDGSKEDKVADESSAKGTPSQLRGADWNTTTNTDRGDKKQDRKATRKMTGSFHKVIPLQPDKTQPDAYDLAVLVQGDKKLIVVPDFANHKLLLLTLNIDMEVAQRSKYDLGAKPWRICEVEQNQVAVTVSEPSGVVICTVDVERSHVEEKLFFPTKKRYDGICALPGRKFVVTVDDSVDIIQDNGTVLKEHEIKAPHVKFPDTSYVTVTPNSTIVVTDCGGNTASFLKQDGIVMWRKNIKCLGVACDSDGNVYVAETGQGSIVQFSSRGRLVCRVIGESEHFSKPSGVAVDNMGYLYVMCNYKDVTVWKLGHEAV
ncbi:uncharacterized protein LOC124262630 [Haliotis rubra]|uniref:uncharacterized protein LOC124262630 n=1 Tax=Haliotis rubra TaxID=36100 RepID=UPI001EE57E7A|nr:uncharacterized protein LOC124262630 [Haliotis rubra]XP_046553095.1 uncharacterized protein LOC124262630 [Haliotis rubra]